MKRLLMTLPLALCACTPEMDMQGVDPNDYYAAHPIANRVETKNVTHLAHFGPGQKRLSRDEIESLRAALRKVTPAAAESVQVQLSKADMHDAARRDHLLRVLRSMGYDREAMLVEPSATLERGDVQINVSYAKVVLPDCPDWRRSPVTTYSNTMQGNFQCATETNLGVMVADPHDLMKGRGRSEMETRRAAKVVQDYRSGAGATATQQGSSGASDASASGASSTATTSGK